jgi:tetratricopeptide (TPR) repeat protein
MISQEAVVFIQINGQEIPVALNGLPYMLVGSVEGRNAGIMTSYRFLVGGSYDEPGHWHPWSFFPVNLEPLISLLNDSELQGLILAYCQIDERFRQHLREWAITLAHYTNYKAPTAEAFYRRIARKRRAYKEEQIPDWMSQTEFQSLSTQLHEIVKASETMTVRIMKQIRKAYPDYVSPGELGDQRAKDLIDRANEQPGISAQQAMKLLKKALRYGTTGIQASKAYMRLGMLYEDIGDINQAIKYYDLSLKAWKEYPYAYFVCGKLYYQQSEYTEAINNIRKALQFPLEDWGDPEDYEQARQLLTVLESLP